MTNEDLQKMFKERYIKKIFKKNKWNIQKTIKELNETYGYNIKEIENIISKIKNKRNSKIILSSVISFLTVILILGIILYIMQTNNNNNNNNDYTKINEKIKIPNTFENDKIFNYLNSVFNNLSLYYSYSYLSSSDDNGKEIVHIVQDENSKNLFNTFVFYFNENEELNILSIYYDVFDENSCEDINKIISSSNFNFSESERLKMRKIINVQSKIEEMNVGNYTVSKLNKNSLTIHLINKNY